MIATRDALAVLIIYLSLTTQANAGDIYRYVFQEHVGEGNFSLFQVDVNYRRNKGELCFLDTVKATHITMETEGRMYKGEIWTHFVSMENEDATVCAKFDLYPPSNRFYVSSLKDGSDYHTFAFVGRMDEKKMEGVLMEYYENHFDGMVDRGTEDIVVNASGNQL